MLRKIGLKMSLIYALSLVMILSFGSMNALADDGSKVVTVTVPTTVTCPDYAIGNVLQSISTSTYAYDDGSYKGTLSFSGFSNFSSTYYASYPNVTLYNYTFDRTYTGTVYPYTVPPTMNVTASRHYDITAPLYAVDSIKQSMANSTYAYDDGSYKGTLSYVSLTNYSETYQTSYPGIVLYKISFDVNYAGTVTKY